MGSPERSHPNLVELHNLFKNNRKDEVLNALLTVADNTEDKQLRKLILLLSSDWNAYNDKKLTGQMTPEEDRVALSKLNTRILDIIERIPREKDLQKEKVIDDIRPKEQDAFDALLVKMFKAFSLVLFLAAIGGIVFLVARAYAGWLGYMLCIVCLIFGPTMFILLRKYA